jgi:hypothetical protein
MSIGFAYNVTLMTGTGAQNRGHLLGRLREKERCIEGFIVVKECEMHVW